MRYRPAKKVLWLLWLSWLLCACSSAVDQQSDYVDLIFFDVGQGDGIAVRSPEGNVVVIDGAIVQRLRAYGIESVDIAIASHADTDHISGLESVLRSMPVGYYMDNGYPHDIAAYGNIALLLEGSNTVYLQPAAGDISLGSVTLTILPPPTWTYSDQNNASIGVIVGFGGFMALLTGDSEVPELNYFLELGVPDVTVLKAAHHGSRNGLTPRWLDVTRPEVVVISCGENNPYGHPEPWALRYYGTVASEVYRTDWHGEVLVRGYSDGTYEVVTQYTAQ